MKNIDYRDSYKSNSGRHSHSSRKTSFIHDEYHHHNHRLPSTDQQSHLNLESARNSVQSAGISSLHQNLVDEIYEKIPEEYVITEEYESESRKHSDESQQSGRSTISHRSSTTRSSSSASSSSFVGMAPEPMENQSRWKRSDSTKRAHQLGR